MSSHNQNQSNHHLNYHCLLATTNNLYWYCNTELTNLWTSLFTTSGSRNKRRKYRQQTNKQWCDLTILTKVCMTITTKKKRLANTDIEIRLNFLQNLLLFVSSISVRRGKLQEWHSSTMSLFAVLNNFIKNRVEEIHSVGTINNVETSYFTQLKTCYLMTTFRQCLSENSWKGIRSFIQERASP